MGTMMKRAAELAIRRPRTVMVAWLLVFMVGVGVGSAVFGRLGGLGAGVPGSESQVTAKQIDKLDPGTDTIVGLVVGTTPGQPVAAAQGVRDRVEAAVADLRRIPGVANVPDPYATPGMTGDGQAVAIPVTFTPEVSASSKLENAALKAAEARLRAVSGGPGDTITVKVSGGPLLNEALNQTAQSDAQKAETLSLPIVLVLLLLIFGGFLAAALPLILALCGIAATLLILYGFSFATDLSVYSVQITTMLGLGLGVDYALLMVTRFKQERAATPAREDIADCVRRTVDRAGRTVCFSGLTVAVSLAGIVVYQASFLRSMGLAAAAVVAVDMLAAVTLLPALLTRYGHRVAPAKGAADGTGRRSGAEGRAFAWIAAGVVRRPLPALLGIGAILLVAAAPAAGLAWTSGDARELPESAEGRQVYELSLAHFPGHSEADSIKVLLSPDAARGGYAQHLRSLPGVVDSSQKTLSDGSTLVRLIPSGTDDGPVATGLVKAIRGEGHGAKVTGNTAHLVDFKQMLSDRLPYAVGVVLLSVLVLLFLFTGSVLIPLKAVLTNLLSIGAALGAVVWVFQEGHLSGVLGTGKLGSLDVTVPPLMIAVAFGLSMDYEIFILGRIREARLNGEDPRAAVVTGIRHTGRVVTSAALLLMIVFACFMTGGAAPILEFGLGLTLAIGIDATLVRMLLVPATLAVLGERAWWAPKPLARLHRRFGVSESQAPATVPATRSTDRYAGSQT
jgi:RND superfamily putative drug exporter